MIIFVKPLNNIRFDKYNSFRFVDFVYKLNGLICFRFLSLCIPKIHVGAMNQMESFSTESNIISSRCSNLWNIYAALIGQYLFLENVFYLFRPRQRNNENGREPNGHNLSAQV